MVKFKYAATKGVIFMKQWMKKVSAIFITVLTLGMYIPPAILSTNAETDKDNLASKADYDKRNIESTEDVEKNGEMDVDIHLPPVDKLDEPSLTESETIIQAITEQAKTQSIDKLGPKIAHQIEDEFTMMILPEIEDVITHLLADMEDDAPYIGITEKPSTGYGERIFNIYDYRTQRDIARFDVRRDNRPQDGYWFNFHYHLGDDNFEKHYEIGEIFWNKNTPPKWMS